MANHVRSLFGFWLPYTFMIRLHPNVGCRFCGSRDTIKHGTRRTRVVGVRQRYLCKTCGRTFTVDDGFLGLHYPREVVTETLDLYYSGLSLRGVAAFMRRHCTCKPSYGAVYTWIHRFVAHVSKHLNRMCVEGSGFWSVDETVVKVKGVKHWLWTCFDVYLGVVLAWLLSADRRKQNAIQLLRQSRRRDTPVKISTDLYYGYRPAVKRVFHTASLHEITSLYEGHNNRLERLFGSLKDRTKVMRGLKSPQKAETLLTGWLIHHQHVRKADHNKWLQLITEATHFLINFMKRLIISQNQPLI